MKVIIVDDVGDVKVINGLAPLEKENYHAGILAPCECGRIVLAPGYDGVSCKVCVKAHRDAVNEEARLMAQDKKEREAEGK